MKFLIKGIKNTELICIYTQAKTPEDAKTNAYDLGITPLEIKEIYTNNIFTQFLPINQQELISNFKQIAMMIEAALPIDEILLHCIASCKQTKIRLMYEDILKNLKIGLSLSEAFKKHNHIIGEMSLSMIQAGQNTGNLSKIFNILAQDMQDYQKDISHFKKKLFYPLIVLLSLILAFGILNAMVIPEFILLFEEMGIELPLNTKILITIGDFFQKWGFLSGCILIGSAILLKYLTKKSKKLNKTFHQIFLKIPIVGNIILYRDLQRSLFALHISQKSGLDIKSSLKNAYDCITNLHIKNIFQQIIFQIEKGSNLTQALHYVNLFDSMTQGLLLAGEQSGNLDTMLQISSLHYKELYTEKIDKFTQYIEPSMTLLIGILVMWFALAILMPMWDMNNITL
ncbi:type II secretion system F family protein [Helicobacter sp. 13S00477-4]|uniref:type II secretion system F family protein n=1 Tax=Helicobacter sp. 13S00477-4 TaxID=1905759 RepID=UPI000BA5AC55|nr:type II secretion system F family protein [Helicobacter sp. 13S00477-4]PAF52319.1 hypothetical protein BKH44_03160 [Helicobacter sp. 13S00477-4]